MIKTQKEMRELNREYRRCKRNIAFCKRMDKKREKIKNAELAKLRRKTNRAYRRYKRQYTKIIREEQRDEIRLYRGKVIWCKRNAASINECILSNDELQELGRPLPLKICTVILFIFMLIISPILLPIAFLIDYIENGR